MALPDEQLILGRGAENLQNDSYCHLPRVQGVDLLGAAMYIPGSEPEIFDSQDPLPSLAVAKSKGFRRRAFASNWVASRNWAHQTGLDPRSRSLGFGHTETRPDAPADLAIRFWTSQDDVLALEGLCLRLI
jgi:hypothetical protein